MTDIGLRLKNLDLHCSKDFSIFSSGGHLVYRSGMILAILVGSHLGNIPMKFESHWPKA